MKLRFEVDQAAAFRKGIDAPTSIVTIDVNPGELTPDVRELIASRLYGIEVCRLVPAIPVTDQEADCGHFKIHVVARKREPVRIMATGIEFKDLLIAIRENERQLNGQTGQRLFLDQNAVPFTIGSMP